MREKWVQELKNLAKVRVKWVPGQLNKADLLTKCFPNCLFQSRKQLATGSNAARLARAVSPRHSAGLGS